MIKDFSKRREDTRWWPVYQLLRTAEYGQFYSYAQLDAAIGGDIRSSTWIIRRADKELSRHDRRAVENVRNQGYRVVEPVEHLALMRKRETRARRQASKGIAIGLATDLNLVSDPVDRANIAAHTTHLRMIEARLSANELRAAQNAEAIQQVRRQVSEETAMLQARIDRLEAERGTSLEVDDGGVPSEI